MNAFLAGLLVTGACFSLAYTALRCKSKWQGSKAGLIIYALGTFTWSLKGVELGDYSLILISALQTLAIIIGVILL